MRRKRSKGSDEPPAERLSAARERFAREWLDFRDSARLETGWQPRWSSRAVLPVLAFALGAALGAGIWWRRKGR